ncbi:MAG TPA: Xaa-Pro peptidase family protein [Casimicrobiaceae bacterium]|nr:Xaa-Pro peptidase family protein [Casimicrobiaceae bacterium]
MSADSEIAAIAPSEFAARRQRTVELVRRGDLKGLLVFARGGGTLDRYADVLYLTNYYTPYPYIPDLQGNWSARAHTSLIVPATGEPTLIIDSPNDGRIALPAEQIVYTDFIVEETILAMRKSGLDRGPVGLVGADAMPSTTYNQIAAALPDVQWRDAQSILIEQRMIKSPAEIALLRRSAKIGSRMIEAMMAAAEPGATHGDVVAAGLQSLVPAGGMLYNSFMASGRGGDAPVLVKSNFPTWGSKRPLENGMWLRLGISGVVDGYYFDVSRSKAIGAPSKRQIELFEAAMAACDAGIAATHAGTTAGQVGDAGLKKQESLGFPIKGVFSALGHGIGLGWDSPWLARGDKTQIVPNMVLNYERTISDGGGYLGDYEDTILVTSDGIERLTDAQKRFW